MIIELIEMRSQRGNRKANRGEQNRKLLPSLGQEDRGKGPCNWSPVARKVAELNSGL